MVLDMSLEEQSWLLVLLLATYVLLYIIDRCHHADKD